MNRPVHSIAQRWRRTIVGFLLVLVGSVASFGYLYGHGSWASVAHVETRELLTMVSSQWFGTTAYADAPAPTHSESHWWTSMLNITNPRAMLTGELLPVASSTDTHAQSDGSLVRSLQTGTAPSGPIVMGWAPESSTQGTIQMMKSSPGLNVISPIWISLAAKNGDLSSHIDSQVVSFAHQHNIQVWAMVDNQFQSSLTHDVLSNAKVRAHLISQLMALSQKNHLDGLNIDFENIDATDRQDFTNFMRELHQAARANRLVLSVDVAPDIQFTKDDAAYFHAALSEYADYVVLMAYEEHWGGDSTPGPVADVPWTTQSVRDLLNTGVPSDQLILGLPFYSRFWHVQANGNVRSEAIADTNVSSILTKHQAVSHWDGKLGVSYAKYAKSDGYEEAWIETPQTMQEKVQLVRDDGLAGVSVWSLGLSNEETWTSSLGNLTNPSK